MPLYSGFLQRKLNYKMQCNNCGIELDENSYYTGFSVRMGTTHFCSHPCFDKYYYCEYNSDKNIK